jgi:large subunit ribosomal protein L30
LAGGLGAHLASPEFLPPHRLLKELTTTTKASKRETRLYPESLPIFYNSKTHISRTRFAEPIDPTLILESRNSDNALWGVQQKPFNLLYQPKKKTYTMTTYFRITLMRSAIGLPARTNMVLHALGLKKRMATVFYPVSLDVAGQIMKVKELVSVQEVDEPLTKAQVHMQRKPDLGYYVEQTAEQQWEGRRFG